MKTHGSCGRHSPRPGKQTITPRVALSGKEKNCSVPNHPNKLHTTTVWVCVQSTKGPGFLSDGY